MPAKKKETEKKPLNMTTDEAIEFLFGQEGAQTLKEYVREKVNPPSEKESESASAKSSRKHSSK